MASLRSAPPPARACATREAAERDCRTVTYFLALGFPAVVPRGDKRGRSAVRMAADLVGGSRAQFARRIGAPGQPGAHFRMHGLQPDWEAGAKAQAARGELGTAPVLPGYVLKSVATQRDAEGNIEREWVQQARAPAPPAPLPAGHVLKGVSRLVDGQGNILAEWQKTREEERDPQALATALREAMLDVRGVAPVVALPVDQDTSLLTVYVIPDLHLGMMAHGAECGEDYDLRIAAEMVRRETGRLLAMAPPSRHAVVLFLGDFFHQNDQKNATPRGGHTLDVDGRWKKVYGVGARVSIGVAQAVAKHHQEVEIAFLPGNHDEDAALTLAVALELYFEGHSRIRVASGYGIHWFRRFGRCLLGASHGHTLKPDRMAWLLATDRPQDWGETEHRHFFFGHIHHESAKEIGRVRVESFSSPAAKDAYAAAGGYRSSRALNAVTFHAEDGEVCRHRVNIRGATPLPA